MTSSVDQSALEVEMEALARVYVTTQAFAIDSLVNTTIAPDPWHPVQVACKSASEQIYKAISDLVCAYHYLEESS